MATTLPAEPESTRGNALSAVNREFAQTLNVLSDHAKKGVGVYFQILGGALISFSFIVRVLSAFSPAESISDKFTTFDFLVAIAIGFLILLVGGGQRIYEYKMRLENHRTALEFSREREREAGGRQQELENHGLEAA